GLVALAGGLRAGNHLNAAVAGDGEHDALEWRSDRRLDIVGEPDAAQPAVAPARLAALREARPIRTRERGFHVAAKVAAVIGEAHRGTIRQLLLADQVAPPDVDPVDVQP